MILFLKSVAGLQQTEEKRLKIALHWARGEISEVAILAVDVVDRAWKLNVVNISSSHNKQSSVLHATD